MSNRIQTAKGISSNPEVGFVSSIGHQADNFSLMQFSLPMSELNEQIGSNFSVFKRKCYLRHLSHFGHKELRCSLSD